MKESKLSNLFASLMTIEGPKSDLYQQLSPEEKALADALVELTAKVGPLDQASGIWTGYSGGSSNPVANIGVHCSHCALYKPDTSTCMILSFKVEPKGYCRFAVIPDGLVNAAGK